MQFTPYLMSITAPLAAKSAKAAAHVAQEVGQSFLHTLTHFAEGATEQASALLAADSAALTSDRLDQFATQFRDWLASHGIHSPFHLKFYVAENGDPVSNVTGPQSEQIVDLLYSDTKWLDKLTQIAQSAAPPRSRAHHGAAGVEYTNSSGPRTILLISSKDAGIQQEPARAY